MATEAHFHHEHPHHDHDDEHGHSHDHNHSHAPSKFGGAFFIAMLVNAAFVVLQVIYAIIAHSNSLLADAAHNFGDVLSLAFAWVATLLLSKKSSSTHSYGLKKTTILAAMTNALVLMLTCGIIIVDAIERLLSPTHSVAAMDVMIVAAIGIVVNGSTALLFMKGQEDLNVKAAFLHLAYDALISLGVVIAAAIIYFTHWNWLDPVVGLGIMLIIIYGTWGLLRDSMNLAVDAVPASVDLAKVKAYLASLPNVTEVHDLHIWGLSTRETALTAHLVMPETNLTDAERQHIEQTLRDTYSIHHSTIQIEQGHEQHFCERSC